MEAGGDTRRRRPFGAELEAAGALQLKQKGGAPTVRQRQGNIAATANALAEQPLVTINPCPFFIEFHVDIGNGPGPGMPEVTDLGIKGIIGTNNR